MTKLSDRAQRIFYTIYSIYITFTGLWLFLILLPFRPRKSSTSQPSTPIPKVTITIHDPPSSPKDTVALIHGFPDSPDLFKHTITQLTQNGYRCLAVALPGSNGEQVPPTITPRDVAEQIHTAIQQITTQPVAVVSHDWGSFYTMITIRKYPQTFSRAVYLDVGSISTLEPSAWCALMAYQAMLAVAFLLGGPAGNFMVHAFLYTANYNVRPVHQVTSDMCYHYYAFWKSALKGWPLHSARTENNMAQMYIYGAKKPFMFHDNKWISRVNSSPHGEVVPLPVGHWVMIEDKSCNKLIQTWLDKSRSSKTTST